MATGRCSGGFTCSAATTRMPTTAATATTMAATITARGGPSGSAGSSGLATEATLRPAPVGDRTGQGASDPRDVLDMGNDVVLQLVERGRADADHDVVWAGHVLG